MTGILSLERLLSRASCHRLPLKSDCKPRSGSSLGKKIRKSLRLAHLTGHLRGLFACDWRTLLEKKLGLSPTHRTGELSTLDSVE